MPVKIGTIKALLPESAKAHLRSVRSWLTDLNYYGQGRWCPVCEKSSRLFRPYDGIPGEAICIHCGAHERHRFVWLYFSRYTDLFDGHAKRVLHVAPETCMEPRLRQNLGGGYVTADMGNRQAMLKMDVTDIQCPDKSFDVIYCSHVLEHVPDDRRAISELYRVLKNGGWAILLVPITADRTIEDPSIVDPMDRLRLYGEKDHVRRYGPDFVDRLTEAGFSVTVVRVSDLFDNEAVIRMGLTKETGDIYYCTKSSS
jgi:hypothetical protein